MGSLFEMLDLDVVSQFLMAREHLLTQLVLELLTGKACDDTLHPGLFVRLANIFDPHLFAHLHNVEMPLDQIIF